MRKPDRLENHLNHKQPPKNMCVIESLSSMTYQVAPEAITEDELFDLTQREFRRLEYQREHQMKDINLFLHRKLNRGERRSNFEINERHIEASRRLDRILVQNTYAQFFASLGEQMNAEFQLDFLFGDASKISDLLEFGFAIAVITASHIACVSRDENGDLVDLSSDIDDPFLNHFKQHGISPNMERYMETGVLDEELLNDFINYGIKDSLRVKRLGNRIPSSFWNIVSVKRAS